MPKLKCGTIPQTIICPHCKKEIEAEIELDELKP